MGGDSKVEGLGDEEAAALYKVISSFYEENGVKPKLGSHYGDYVGSALWRISHLFKAVGLVPGKRFLDLGAGDGRVAVYAGVLGSESRGVEHDPVLYEKSVELADQMLARLGEDGVDRTVYEKSVRWDLGGGGVIELINASYLDDGVSFEGEDFIFHYEQSTGINPVSQLCMKLQEQMKPKAVLVEHGLAPDTPDLPPPFKRVPLEGPAMETMRAHRIKKSK
jgi:hypothetical protein